MGGRRNDAGHAKVRPPVPSWHKVNEISPPGAELVIVDEVTVPVRVIRKLLASAAANVGVAENGTVTTEPMALNMAVSPELRCRHEVPSNMKLRVEQAEASMVGRGGRRKAPGHETVRPPVPSWQKL